MSAMTRASLILFFLLSLAGCARNVAEQLTSSDERVRQAAMAKLQSGDVSLRREVIPIVAAKLSSENGNVRRRAAQALAGMGSDAVNPLLRTLQSGSPQARAAAAETLGFLGADAKSAVGPLVEAERDADPEVRRWAAVSIGRIKETMSPSELNLFGLLYGKKEAAAGGKKEDFSREDPRALLERLRRSDFRTRGETALALVEKGPLVLPLLMKALKDPDEGVRDGAAQALRILSQNQASVDKARGPRPVSTEGQRALARLLDARWADMASRLARRETEAALNYFEEARREDYRAAFLALGDALPRTGSALNCKLSFHDAPDDRQATLEGTALIEGVRQTLLVRFVKDDNGEWKIRGF